MPNRLHKCILVYFLNYVLISFAKRWLDSNKDSCVYTPIEVSWKTKKTFTKVL